MTRPISPGVGRHQPEPVVKGRRQRYRLRHRKGDIEHAAPPGAAVLLVGSPNVGKSLVFHRLTGVYVTVSNYPGTTVELTRGIMREAGHEYEVVDTPGIYSIKPISEEERVARDLILGNSVSCVVQVLDAKNLGRMLPLTLELLETGLPLVIAVNMMDEAEQRGLQVDATKLADALGVRVVKTSAPTGRGIDELRKAIAELAHHVGP